MIAGVDGCKRGWLVAISAGWPCEELPELVFCRDFSLVLETTVSCSVVVVDMPIGLPSGDECRKCDIAARDEIGRKDSKRIFMTPPRQSLQASTAEEFQQIHRRLKGKGAGIPVWGIAQKLKEVDAEMNPKIQEHTMEFHPELAWKQLAGNVLASKHTAKGILQRLEFIKKFIPEVAGFGDVPAATRGKIDDVLDALVGLATAHSIATGPDYNRRLPLDEPGRDERGLRMEIWF